MDRTEAQRAAKEGSADSYLDKAAALDRQIASLRDQLILKQKQLDQKLRQIEFKITTQEANIANAEAQLAVADHSGQTGRIVSSPWALIPVANWRRS